MLQGGFSRVFQGLYGFVVLPAFRSSGFRA